MSSTSTAKASPKTKKKPAKAAPSRPASEGHGAPAPAGAITTYATALRWLYEHANHERMRLIKYNTATFNLNRMARLLKVLDNPQKDVKFVHIAGTKGKGSTVAMLSNTFGISSDPVAPYIIDSP